jgi:hypothetical protein
MSSRRRRARALAPRPPESLDRTRALAKFGSLTGRAVAIGFVAIGPLVPAENPEQLAEAFADWLKGEVGRDPLS